MQKEKCKKRTLVFGMLFLPFAFCLLSLTVTGCRKEPDAYPAEITYSPRQSWLVIELPKNVPTQPEPNGELDEGIRRINDRGGRVLDPGSVPVPLREELSTFLQATFGTPAQPTILGDDDSRALADSIGLTDANLAQGSRLFRERCQECHGASGDGRGVTAPWLTPHPRDFRAGAFKFTSTGKKPTRADLFRTLTFGLKPTAMPSFGMRSDEDRQRLIDYVMFLSIRGKTEFDTLKTLLLYGEEGLNSNVAGDALETLTSELRAWSAAESQVIAATPIDDSPDSIRRGQALFLDAKAGACATCHLNYGRESKLQYDQWGTLIRPANLTEFRRKGGDGAAELFRRIRGGIPPANMPAAHALSDAQTWDIVNFLRALPYPDRLPDDVKGRIYRDGE